jgi:GntR family transcriptional repressor for pyruvate dehydrogenase complex
VIYLISRDNLSDQVKRYLIKYIKEHNLKSGDELPAEMEIAEKLGISRGIVREGLRSLFALGIIDIVSGKRNRVSVFDHKVLGELFYYSILTEQSTNFHVLEARKAIEISAAKLAAVRRTAKELEDLESIINLMRTAQGDSKAYTDWSAEFHRLVAQSSHNLIIYNLIISLNELIKESIEAGLFGRRTEEDFKIIQERHERIFEAIVERDPNKAEKAMTVHFEEAVKHVEESEQLGFRQFNVKINNEAENEGSGGVI